MNAKNEEIVNLLFDPRDGKYAKSDNPALIFADICKREFELNSFQWILIGQMADYCDERMVAA